MITPIAEADIPAVTALESLCFAQPWNGDNVRGELEKNPFSSGYKIVQDGAIIAYAFLWETFETAQLVRIGVHPDWRRQKLAETLLRFLEEQARQAGCEVLRLEVRQDNGAARRLYEKLGYVELNKISRYYADGETALVMGKGL